MSLLFYLLRWQASTPVLAGVIYFLGAGLVATAAANLIGGLLFYLVDRRIFHRKGADGTPRTSLDDSAAIR